MGWKPIVMHVKKYLCAQLYNMYILFRLNQKPGYRYLFISVELACVRWSLLQTLVHVQYNNLKETEQRILSHKNTRSSLISIYRYNMFEYTRLGSTICFSLLFFQLTCIQKTERATRDYHKCMRVLFIKYRYIESKYNVFWSFFIEYGMH